ncbi:VOC family protein [Pseudolabrys taiwanensis]|uniref:VOC family protein n=1 Tax=Pseudolabrys taiwanensis TaxID=331696 RepID=A0A345ZSH0_9HYPH|nr:VOC family protein [Pseudolabrys taiwanensis]AXK79867.1 VOC family protein [Pseudolabrys taiwanensis]
MPRGLDHIVHAVRDLDAAAALYRSLGFTVGARNKHPWGTHNHIVQTPGFFIELVTFAEPDKLGDDGFSKLFAAHNRDFIARGDGLSLLILESADAAADEAAFRKAGIAGSPAMRFEREGKRPDGTTVKVGFSLAFADDQAAPDIHFATCQQHFPENFWNPAFQQHANGVKAVAGVVAVARDQDVHRRFFEDFTGAPATSIDGGFSIVTPRGVVDVLTAAAFLHRFGVKAPEMRGGLWLAALRFFVADAAPLQALPELAGLGGLYAGNPAVVGAEDAMGAVLVFEPG